MDVLYSRETNQAQLLIVEGASHAFNFRGPSWGVAPPRMWLPPWMARRCKSSLTMARRCKCSLTMASGYIKMNRSWAISFSQLEGDPYLGCTHEDGEQSVEGHWGHVCLSDLCKVCGHAYHRLHHTRKGSMTMSDYFSKMNSLVDDMKALGKPVNKNELIEYILMSLDYDYNLVDELRQSW